MRWGGLAPRWHEARDHPRAFGRTEQANPPLKRKKPRHLRVANSIRRHGQADDLHKFIQAAAANFLPPRNLGRAPGLTALHGLG